METVYLLGIDIGTSAAKLLLFESERLTAPLAASTVAYPTAHPAPRQAEQDPEDWWRATVEGIRELLSQARIAPASIAGIGVDGQSWAAVALDRAGRVLCPTPIWSDTRAEGACQRLRAEVGEAPFLAVSGNPLAAGYTYPKLRYYRDACPEVYRSTAAVLQSNGYIVYRLTGKLSHDRSQGYGLSCFDIRSGEWDRTLCRAGGVDPELLPPLFDPHEVVGTVTPEAAAATGLAVGTPVVAGGLDTACDALGLGVLATGQVQEQGGQSGGMSICLDAPIIDRRLILCRHVVPGHWLLQGGTVGGGAILRWFEREFGAAYGNSYAEMDREAAAVPAGAEGLLLLPYLAGERSPIFDPEATGVYFGLDYGKTRGHFARANLEAAAYALRHNLEVAERAGAPVHELYASGGAAKSPLWTQIKADVTGCRIRVPAVHATAARGAAILAGVGTGVLASFEDAVRGITLARTHEPDPATASVYAAGYQTYLALYRALAPLMHQNKKEVEV